MGAGFQEKVILNLYHAKFDVISFIFMGSQEKYFSLNKYFVKSGVISFWVGGRSREKCFQSKLI